MKVQTRRRQVVTRTEACLSSLSLKKTQPNNKNQTPKKEGGGGVREKLVGEDSDMFIPLENNSFDLQGGV